MYIIQYHFLDPFKHTLLNILYGIRALHELAGHHWTLNGTAVLIGSVQMMISELALLA